MYCIGLVCGCSLSVRSIELNEEIRRWSLRSLLKRIQKLKYDDRRRTMLTTIGVAQKIKPNKIP